MTTNPVNSLIPMAAEMLKMAGITNLNRLFGVTTINSIRANTLTADILGVDPECVVVPIIGGNCPKTCVPLFSSARPCNSFTHVSFLFLYLKSNFSFILNFIISTKKEFQFNFVKI